MVEIRATVRRVCYGVIAVESQSINMVVECVVDGSGQCSLPLAGCTMTESGAFHRAPGLDKDNGPTAHSARYDASDDLRWSDLSARKHLFVHLFYTSGAAVPPARPIQRPEF